MLRLSDQEISELYAMICHYHNTILPKKGCACPSFAAARNIRRMP